MAAKVTVVYLKALKEPLIQILFSHPALLLVTIMIIFNVNMPAKGRKGDQRWSMYRSLHHDVSRLLEEDDLHFSFHRADEAANCSNEYDTNIMGRFICRNPACDSGGWSSKKIAITIRMYHSAEYNARVYHQRCKSCNRLSRPILNESYADRVAYRIKKWNGIQLDRPYYSGQSKGPHNSNLCEGCRAGHCNSLVLD